MTVGSGFQIKDTEPIMLTLDYHIIDVLTGTELKNSSSEVNLELQWLMDKQQTKKQKKNKLIIFSIF